MKVGGAAEWLLEPSTPDELAAACNAARERALPLRVLGGGANLIVADGTLPGVVVASERARRVYRVLSEAATIELDETLEQAAQPLPTAVGEEASRVFWEGGRHEQEARLACWAGASMPGLVRIAGELGLSGLEGLVGVPGCIGGGVAMNAGGRWGELWDVVERVRVLEPDGSVRELPRAECAPRYRDGGLGERVVLAVLLRLERAPRAEVQARTRAHLLEKKSAQPVTEASSGCVFKNPDPERSGGRSAGRLIEELGLKGLAKGAAVVSEKHANFVVNRGGARAADVLALIDEVRARVADATGIELVREVKLWASA